MHREAYQEFEKAKEISKGLDAYARLGIANANYHISSMVRHDLEKQERSLRTAMNNYFTILEIDDHNCGGTLGVANVLNEYGKT